MPLTLYAIAGLNRIAMLISGLTAQKTYDTLNRETIYAIGAPQKIGGAVAVRTGNGLSEIECSAAFGRGKTIHAIESALACCRWQLVAVIGICKWIK